MATGCRCPYPPPDQEFAKTLTQIFTESLIFTGGPCTITISNRFGLNIDQLHFTGTVKQQREFGSGTTSTAILWSILYTAPMFRHILQASLAALLWSGAVSGHTIQLKAHSRECFHEQLHRDDRMTVTFQVGDREFGNSGNLDIDFFVRDPNTIAAQCQQCNFPSDPKSLQPVRNKPEVSFVWRLLLRCKARWKVHILLQ
jgi:emp24/gp25L/p24 family/GOLD